MIAALTLVSVALAPAVLAPAALAQPRPAPGRVVVAFVPGVAWEAPGAAVAALTTATARTPFCPADVALTLSAGRRAALPGPGCAAPAHDRGAVSGWAEIVAANAGRHYGAVPGTLAGTLRARGGCVAGSGPLGALVAAGRDGVARPYLGELPGTVPCAVVVADLTGEPTLDAALARLAGVDADAVLLVSLPRRGHLGAVALSPGSGLLRGSTRRAGLVTLTDVAAWLGAGGELTTVPGERDRLPDLDRREHLRRPYAGFYVAGLIALPMLLYIGIGFGRRRPGPRARDVALVLATYPAAGFVSSLVPWWRAAVAWPVAAAAVVAAMALLLGAGLGAARLLRARAEVGVALVSALALALDLLTGGYLQQTGIASYPTITGGRLYGLGNTGFAVLATSALVVAGAAARRHGPRAWLGVLPLVPLVALPRWGADFGGAITLTAALVTALAARSRRLALAGGTLAGVAVAFGVALLDYRRPTTERTHLGRFVGEVLDGGWTDTVARKAGAAAHSLATWYPLLVAGTALTAWTLRHRLDDRTTARAVVVLLALGSLVNDSGLVVAAFGAAVAGPLLVSYAERP